MRTCLICGGAFHVDAASIATTCSPSCRTKLGNQRKSRAVISCAQCGADFAPTRRDGRFCTSRCQHRWARDHERGLCSESDCGRPVRARGLCSKHYRRWARATGIEALPKWDERRRAQWHKRRALSKGAAGADLINSAEVYERDRWVCGICLERVDRRLIWPDPMSPSLDHIVPLSRGGAHQLANVQCAHLSCNVRKGARPET